LYESGQGISYIAYPIMLSPMGDLGLDNNKYLELELTQIPKSAKLHSVDIYTVEQGSISSFVTKYDKMNVPASVARQEFNVKHHEGAFVPVNGFSEIVLTYTNGMVVRRSPFELRCLSSRENDVVFVVRDWEEGFLSNNSVMFGYGAGHVVNLKGVSKFEIVRDDPADAAKPFEFILTDFEPEIGVTQPANLASIAEKIAEA